MCASLPKLILAPKSILSQVRSCNLLGRPAGQGSNKLLIQAEICLDIPPPQGAKRPGGAAEGGAGGISKQISAWMSSLLLPWPAGRPSRLQERTWLRIDCGASMVFWGSDLIFKV